MSFNDSIQKLLLEAEALINDHPESDNLKLEDMLLINPENLDYEITQNPINYAFVAILNEKAAHKEATLKDRHEKIKESTGLMFRLNDDPMTKAITKGLKMTEGTVDAFVTTNNRVEKAKEEYRQAQYEAGVMKEIAKSIGQKGDMLRTLASNARKEREIS